MYASTRKICKALTDVTGSHMSVKIQYMYIVYYIHTQCMCHIASAQYYYAIGTNLHTYMHLNKGQLL